MKFNFQGFKVTGAINGNVVDVQLDGAVTVESLFDITDKLANPSDEVVQRIMSLVKDPDPEKDAGSKLAVVATPQEVPKETSKADGAAKPKTPKAKAPAKKKPATTKTEEAVPTEPENGMPLGLAEAKAFRDAVVAVIDDVGDADVDAIVSTCVKFRAQAPALERAGGDFEDRIRRTANVLGVGAQE